MQSKTNVWIASAGLMLLAGAALAAGPLRDDPAAKNAISHLRDTRGPMGLSQDSDFTALRVVDDELGLTHVRVAQTHRGVKVFGGEAIVHFAGGHVLGVTDDLRRGIGADAKASLSSASALRIAHGALAPKGDYAVAPTAELVFFRDDRSRDALAYHVHTELENARETRHTDFMIDARSGKVLDRWDSLHTAGTTGTGFSQYSGTVSLDVNSIAGGYELKDTTRGGATGNRTFNLNHATSGTGTLYTDADNSWGDGANYVEGSSTTAANGQTAGVDAHFGMTESWDYYVNVHGHNGIDGAGRATYSRVHYSNSYDNAFWSDSCFCMTYGDGSAFTTLTSIDVAGHEMSHGVTSVVAGLAYRRESGGLNEATSDIFGTAIEFYSRGGTGGNWLIGEQLRGTPLRYMYNPSLDGRSANCWSKQTGSLDVHYSSGVGNHFFYLLSQGSAGSGGSPTSPTCNGSSVSGIGLAKAEKIWFRALNVYMTSSTTYSGARAATLSAASDLYGAGSAERAAVLAAWAAVNVTK